MKYVAKVPLRMSFFGGGTDVPPYCDEYGGEILYSTISKYAYCEITAIEEEVILLGENNEIYDEKDVIYSGGYGFVKAVLKELKMSKGFKIRTYCDVGKGTGLGGSSAQIAAVILACYEWNKSNISKKDLVKLVFHIERNVLNIKCGYQDAITTVHGGFGYLKVRNIDDYEIEDIHVSHEDISRLRKSLMLCNTGIQHNSSEIIDDQMKQQEEDKKQSAMLLTSMKEQANQAKKVLEKGDFALFGQMLNQEWEYKKQMSKYITNAHINNLYEKALALGAVGGKVLGAGGGGHLLLYVPTSVQEYVGNSLWGNKIISGWEFDYIGARIEKF